MNPDVWGVFHDGTITAIVGDVPGLMELQIDIEYLRAMFGGFGCSFRIRLLGCTKAEYREYGDPTVFKSSEIASREPEVLYVHTVDPLVLDCTNGQLELSYESMEVRLDSGESVTYDQLCSASRRYWNK